MIKTRYENIYWLYDAALHSDGNKVTVVGTTDSDNYDIDDELTAADTNVYINFDAIYADQLNRYVIGVSTLYHQLLVSGVLGKSGDGGDFMYNSNLGIIDSNYKLTVHGAAFNSEPNIFDTYMIDNDRISFRPIDNYFTDDKLHKVKEVYSESYVVTSISKDDVKEIMGIKSDGADYKELLIKLLLKDDPELKSNKLSYSRVINHLLKLYSNKYIRNNNPDGDPQLRLYTKSNDTELKIVTKSLSRSIEFIASVSPLQLSVDNSYSQGDGASGFMTGMPASVSYEVVTGAQNAGSNVVKDIDALSESVGADSRSAKWIKWLKKMTQQRYKMTTNDVLAYQDSGISIPLSVTRTFVTDRKDYDITAEISRIGRLMLGECLPVSEGLSSNNILAKEEHQANVNAELAKIRENTIEQVRVELAREVNEKVNNTSDAAYIAAVNEYNKVGSFDEAVIKRTEAKLRDKGALPSTMSTLLAGLGNLVNTLSGAYILRAPLGYLYSSKNYLRGMRSRYSTTANTDNQRAAELSNYKNGDEWPGTIKLIYPSNLVLGGLVVAQGAIEYSNVHVMTDYGLRPLTATINLTFQPARVWTLNDFADICKFKTVI